MPVPTIRPVTLVRVPRPRSLPVPVSNVPGSGYAAVVNLQSPQGMDQRPDFVGELGSRIASDIKSARDRANVDVAGLVKAIKAQQSNWKPPVIPLPALKITGGVSRGRGGPVPGVRLSGGVDQWIAQAYRILGVPLTAQALANERYLIQHESGGNPRAINNWDINAKRGTPSMGLAQTIMPTFKAYMLPGHGDIWNPVDNLIASLRYRKSRYKTYNIGQYKGGY